MVDKENINLNERIYQDCKLFSPPGKCQFVQQMISGGKKRSCGRNK